MNNNQRFNPSLLFGPVLSSGGYVDPGKSPEDPHIDEEDIDFEGDE